MSMDILIQLLASYQQSFNLQVDGVKILIALPILVRHITDQMIVLCS